MKNTKRKCTCSFEQAEINGDYPIYIGNKIISYRKADTETIEYYVSREKDLLANVAPSVYLSLSDFGNINEIFVNLGLYKKFNKEEYNRFIHSFGVSTYVGTFEKVTKDFIYASNVQTLSEYGIDTLKKDLKDYIKYITAINNFNSSFIKHNSKDPTINQEQIHESYITANENDINEVLKLVNYDLTTGELLSQKYERKLFK